MKFELVNLILLLLAVASEEVIDSILVNRACSSYNTTLNFKFELNKFEGTWYEIAKYGKLKQNCTTDYVQHIQNTTHSTMIHSTKNDKNHHNTTIIIEQIFNVTNGLDFKILNHTLQMKMLATDYKSYAVLWSCSDSSPPENGWSNQTLVILSRNNTKKFNDFDDVNKVLNATGIKHDNITLSSINHLSATCNNGGEINAIHFVPFVILTLFINIL